MTDGAGNALPLRDQRHDDARRPAAAAARRARRRCSGSAGRSTSSTTTCSAAARATSTSATTTPTSSSRRSGSRAWRPTPTTRAGSTSSSSARGEFTLEFGDYDVSITVPADHIVAATGVLQNPDEVLTAAQRDRLAQARTADKPVVHRDARRRRERPRRTRTTATKTWHFKAKNVRDFAFASAASSSGMRRASSSGEQRRAGACPSIPKEGNPLWERYSTQAVVAHHRARTASTPSTTPTRPRFR